MTIAWLAHRPSRREVVLGGPPLPKENGMESSHVAALQAKHEGLEQRIHDEMSRPAPDSTMIQALKKQKLRIKEELSFS